MVECDRNHISTSHRRRRRLDPDPVDADIAGRDQRGSGLAGANHPGMPKPSVDTLTFGACTRVQGLAAVGGMLARRTLMRLLGIRLQLGLQGCELGKRRIGVGLLLALPALRRFAPVIGFLAVLVAMALLMP